jgi:hypothetical protein
LWASIVFWTCIFVAWLGLIAAWSLEWKERRYAKAKQRRRSLLSSQVQNASLLPPSGKSLLSQSLRSKEKKFQFQPVVQETFWNSLSKRFEASFTPTSLGSPMAKKTRLASYLIPPGQSVQLSGVDGVQGRFENVRAIPIHVDIYSVAEEEKEHLDHPILGYRAWKLIFRSRQWDVMGKLNATGMELSPLNDGYGLWTPGVNQAMHAGRADFALIGSLASHTCPEKGMQCGFWTLNDLNSAWYKQNWPPDNSWFPVAGIVQGWGKYQEHTDGYRVQYASVIALAVAAPTLFITTPALDFALISLKQLCQAWDVIYCEDAQKLRDVMETEKLKVTFGKQG